MDKDKLIAEKTLTYVLPRLCENCRRRIEKVIQDLGRTTAEEIANELGFPFDI